MLYIAAHHGISNAILHQIYLIAAKKFVANSPDSQSLRTMRLVNLTDTSQQ